MTGSPPSDDAVRARAYELWRDRGETHGSDQDDWFRAIALVAEPDADCMPPASAPHSLAEVISSGMQGVAGLAAGAVGVVAALFTLNNPATALPATKAAPDEPSTNPADRAVVDEEALTSRERALQLDQDKRIEAALLVPKPGGTSS